VDLPCHIDLHTERNHICPALPPIPKAQHPQDSVIVKRNWQWCNYQRNEVLRYIKSRYPVTKVTNIPFWDQDSHWPPPKMMA
jgi:hypothetical protein